MIYLDLFWSFFQIGLLSFGGGFAAMPLIQSQVVDKHGWLSQAEFTNLITISEMTPGPIAINASTFVGTQIAGLAGAAVSTAGCILPSCVIVSLLAMLYGRYKDLAVIKGVLGGLRPAVTALILSAGLSIIITSFWGQAGFSPDIGAVDFAAAVLFTAGLIILRKFKPNPILIILGCGIAGGVYYLFI